MTEIAAKPTCPTCWSTRCLATKQNGYRHRWEDGPMAAAHARWKDERTPPAGPEEITQEPVALETDKPVETDNRETDRIAETDNTRPCIECNQPFHPARADARFCSPACRLKAHRRDAATEKATTPA